MLRPDFNLFLPFIWGVQARLWLCTAEHPPDAETWLQNGGCGTGFVASLRRAHLSSHAVCQSSEVTRSTVLTCPTCQIRSSGEHRAAS